MTIQKTCPQKIKIKDVGRLEAREGLAHNFQCNVLTKPPRAVYQSHVSEHNMSKTECNKEGLHKLPMHVTPHLEIQFLPAKYLLEGHNIFPPSK